MISRSTARNLLLAVSVLLASSCLSGCFYLILGSLGAVGGYAVSPDTVAGMSRRDAEEVFDAAYTVVNIMGNVLRQDKKSGHLEVLINNSRVNISILQFSRDKTKISVKARRAFFPKIDIAQDVYVKIINQLNE